MSNIICKDYKIQKVNHLLDDIKIYLLKDIVKLDDSFDNIFIQSFNSNNADKLLYSIATINNNIDLYNKK
jgi:hypothetical protein